MLVKNGKVLLGNGPRENCTRPAIDPLFRTAAMAYGDAVIAVILSGNLDDGTVGLATVKECGGIAIVQDPKDSNYPGMPQSAIDNVQVDYILPLAEIGSKVAGLVGLPNVESAITMCSPSDKETAENDPAEGIAAAMEAKRSGAPSSYTCPDCHGALWEIENPTGVLRFRCRVGHAYSSTSLAAQQGDRVEEALWTALTALEERASLVDRLARRAKTRNQPGTAKRFGRQHRDLCEQAELLRNVLARSQNDAEHPEDQEEA